MRKTIKYALLFCSQFYERNWFYIWKVILTTLAILLGSAEKFSSWPNIILMVGHWNIDFGIEAENFQHPLIEVHMVTFNATIEYWHTNRRDIWYCLWFLAQQSATTWSTIDSTSNWKAAEKMLSHALLIADKNSRVQVECTSNLLIDTYK